MEPPALRKLIAMNKLKFEDVLNLDTVKVQTEI